MFYFHVVIQCSHNVSSAPVMIPFHYYSYIGKSNIENMFSSIIHVFEFLNQFHGSMAAWQNGSMAAWQHGSMAAWHYSTLNAFNAFYLFNTSLYLLYSV